MPLGVRGREGGNKIFLSPGGRKRRLGFSAFLARAARESNEREEATAKLWLLLLLQRDGRFIRWRALSRHLARGRAPAREPRPGRLGRIIKLSNFRNL